MIHVTGICKRFGEPEVLRDVSLDVAEGEILSIVGASGAGKSTLLQIVGTLLKPDAGSVEIAGINPLKLSERTMANFRNRHIGFVFQFHHLLPEFTALENVMMPALIGGVSRREAEVRAAELLDVMGLKERLAHKPNALSGGEQQRVAIARALMNRPSVLLADEPTGNLDSHTRDEVQRLLYKLREEFGQTIIMVTHDEQLASQADRKIVMSDGRIL
ncbi:MAG: ABC transporter ATP-binding protein [Alistipes sp.]|nr:ABC transporter ATP-binding protein [Alistipes sp.]